MLSHFSCVQLFVILWTVACQAPLSMGYSGQEYWSGCHFLLQGIWPRDQTSVFCVNCTAGRFFKTEPPGKPIPPMKTCQMHKNRKRKSLKVFIHFSSSLTSCAPVQYPLLGLRLDSRNSLWDSELDPPLSQNSLGLVSKFNSAHFWPVTCLFNSLHLSACSLFPLRCLTDNCPLLVGTQLILPQICSVLSN